ncbi:MAG: glycine cleavage T C-terminal barrel domain-containing protein [Planctomycetaceae bacterium]
MKRVGLELEGKRIAREGSTIHLGSEQVGEVTSGTFSPTLQKSISMGYIKAELAEIGQEVEIDIRGKRNGARIVPLPFYKRIQ